MDPCLTVRKVGWDTFKDEEILVLDADRWGGFLMVAKKDLDDPQFLWTAKNSPSWDQHRGILKAHGIDLDDVVEPLPELPP